jgi:hypothetical protein
MTDNDASTGARMTDDDERWLPVLGYEGTYEVSNLGRVRSVDRVIDQGNCVRWHRGRLLKPARTGPYPHVFLRTNKWPNSATRTARLHRLVAEAFLEPPPDSTWEVCHNDGDPLNNRAENLRWDSRSENQLDKVRHGTHWQAAKTHCKRNHEFTPENTIRVQQTRNGRVSHQRQCRKCQRIRAQHRKAAV